MREITKSSSEHWSKTLPNPRRKRSSRTQENDTKDVSKSTGNDNRNGCENRMAIIITRHMTAAKPQSNHPQLATWKSHSIQETIQPLPKLASAKG